MVLPERLAIVSGVYLGIEFASIYRRFGSQVTVFEGAPASPGSPLVQRWTGMRLPGPTDADDTGLGAVARRPRFRVMLVVNRAWALVRAEKLADS